MYIDESVYTMECKKYGQNKVLNMQKWVCSPQKRKFRETNSPEAVV